MLDLGHKKLKAWEKGISVIKEVYRITESFPKAETFGLTSQIQRAAVSITANIAEGASRKSINDRKRFYEIARSSLVELDTHIVISIELNIIDRNNIKSLNAEVNEVFALLTAMINNTK